MHIIFDEQQSRFMYQLKPGMLAMIIGSRTAAGRVNVGKSVELFGLCEPGESFVNPVTGVVTQLPHDANHALWLVTGNVVAFDGREGYTFVRAEYLMPLDKTLLPEIEDAQSVH